MKSSKKYLQASGVVIAATAVVSLSTYLTTKFLVKAAVDREGPKAMQKAGDLISGIQQDSAFPVSYTHLRAHETSV